MRRLVQLILLFYPVTLTVFGAVSVRSPEDGRGLGQATFAATRLPSSTWALTETGTATVVLETLPNPSSMTPELVTLSPVSTRGFTQTLATLTPVSGPTSPAGTPGVLSTSSVTPTLGASTPGALADAGKQVFGSICATCHGANGEGLKGPAIIDADANLGIYGDGKGLYDYVSQNMPQDSPGSLSPEEYLQVVAYLLVRNGFVKPGTVITMSNLSSFPLTQ